MFLCSVIQKKWIERTIENKKKLLQVFFLTLNILSNVIYFAEIILGGKEEMSTFSNFPFFCQPKTRKERIEMFYFHLFALIAVFHNKLYILLVEIVNLQLERTLPLCFKFKIQNFLGSRVHNPRIFLMLKPFFQMLHCTK